jgi:hypothetical protein
MIPVPDLGEHVMVVGRDWEATETEGEVVGLRKQG